MNCLLSLAVAFGYFENLFTLRDAVRVQQELVRIKSLNRLLDQVGQQEHLYEIFVEATEGLLVQLSEAIQKGVQEDSFLLDAFNSEYNSNAIITHFRVSSSIREKKKKIHSQLSCIQLPCVLFDMADLFLLFIASDKCVDEAEPAPVSMFPFHASRSILCNKGGNGQNRDR